MTETSLFDLLLKTPEDARAALLDQACAGNTELRQRVEKLLQAHEAAPQAATEYQATASYASPDPAPGTVIAGRYTLVQKLGEGGMGEVWVAKQSEPLKRKVALKLIKAGMDSKPVVQRFEQERQALALMDHPNIAKVYDGGISEDRRPYFVMELVNGLPLCRFCDEARLSISDRLELFVAICHAVQHAHQKGIVHRDIKPSNILVAKLDDKPVPKVIDFGVAKALGGRLTTDTLITQFGAVVGTLEYMAPEQAGLTVGDVDTRADIYSLGVVLYELLTGLRPFDAKRLKLAAYDEMMRIIREVDPSKPSTRISTDQALPSLAAVRQMEPARLTRLLRGELDWVVMKCLEKKRDRRYETANGLARDIQRYLARETVEARPPSTVYRMQKFLARNKGTVIAATLLLLTLIAGMVGTTIGFLKATEEKQHAIDAEKAAVEDRNKARDAATAERQAKQAEELAKEEIKRRLTQVEKGYDILLTIFDDLDIRKIKTGNRPLEAVLADRLVLAEKQLDGSSIADPELVANLQDKLGVSLLGLGFAEKTIPLFQRCLALRTRHLGADHADTLITMNNLAAAYRESGKLDLAIPLLTQTVELKKKKFGLENRSTLSSMNNLALSYSDAGKPTQAMPIMEETLKVRISLLGIDHPETLTSMNNLAGCYRALGKHDLALPLNEQVLAIRTSKLGPEHPDTLTSMNNLAIAYRRASRFKDADELLKNTVELMKKVLGATHPMTLNSMLNLGSNYLDLGQMENARNQYEQAYAISKDKLGPDHPMTLSAMSSLGFSYRKLKQWDKAAPLLTTMIALSQAKMGAEHPTTLDAMSYLSECHLEMGKVTEAISLREKVLAARMKRLGKDQPATIDSMGNLAAAYLRGNDVDKGVALLKQFVECTRTRYGKDTLKSASIVEQVAQELFDVKQWSLAERYLREVLTIREKEQARSWILCRSKLYLARILVEQQKSEEASKEIASVAALMNQVLSPITAAHKTQIITSLDQLTATYTKADKADELAKLKTMKEKVQQQVLEKE